MDRFPQDERPGTKRPEPMSPWPVWPGTSSPSRGPMPWSTSRARSARTCWTWRVGEPLVLRAAAPGQGRGPLPHDPHRPRHGRSSTSTPAGVRRCSASLSGSSCAPGYRSSRWPGRCWRCGGPARRRSQDRHAAPSWRRAWRVWVDRAWICSGPSPRWRASPSSARLAGRRSGSRTASPRMGSEIDRAPSPTKPAWWTSPSRSRRAATGARNWWSASTAEASAGCGWPASSVLPPPSRRPANSSTAPSPASLPSPTRPPCPPRPRSPPSLSSPPAVPAPSVTSQRGVVTDAAAPGRSGLRAGEIEAGSEVVSAGGWTGVVAALPLVEGSAGADR